MIQRIQTIYLLVAGLVLFGLFLFPYVHYNDLVGLGKDVKVTGIYGTSAGLPTHETGFYYILQIIATVVVGLLPLYTIFKFKNRKTGELKEGFVGFWFGNNTACAYKNLTVKTY